MENIFYWIWLSILDLSQIQRNKLIEIFKTPKKIYELSQKELEKITSSEKIIKQIITKEKRKQSQKILYETQKEKIEIITIENNLYPSRLKNIIDFPLVLYSKGNTKLLNEKNTIAIIGTRNNSVYGKNTTLKLSYQIARKNYCVVSGLAKGIDSYAHKGALIAKGKTIAVLGSGINYIYPKENSRLYKEIIEKEGLIISEYPLYTKPIPEYFPKRNRLISGISDKILITEASKKSGSIITANIALDQGKDIYVVPGNITSYQSEGTNNLIKEGAFLVSSLEDILDL
ncbi:MAG: DNA-processing protein DprA [Clostridia bacterium]|nr:DNA-processing protein DprA [Clostridia bacterium]